MQIQESSQCTPEDIEDLTVQKQKLQNRRSSKEQN